MTISALPTLLSLVAAIISFQSSCVLAQFNLQDYIITAPTCSITNDLNVQCDFSNIEPLDGNIASFITGFDNCQGTATRDSELSLSAASGIAVNGAYSVIIDVNTNFNLANGDSETYTFCLMTHLRDANDNLMIYQGQKISTTFTANTEFTVSNLDTQVFDGVGSDVDSDSKIFTITARRCDLSRNEITTPAVAIGDSLFICIDTESPNVVIAAVNGFFGSKTNVPQTDLLLGNTEILGVGTNAITIGTRPFVKFFEDTSPLEIFGTVTLDIANNVFVNNGVRSRQLARTLQTNGKNKFDVEVEVEAQRETSPAAYHSSGTVKMTIVSVMVGLVAL
mmetsp:Transcript_36520/g.88509  ORF Transcript_36520/g.88509 Transcript_36520/m.88509 type:complete len:336 (+) Transcript_36520:290-1297(+)|eukprot:CAMPEP_0113622154 /NCGR_PEP_ID=MMETSP0017_2-20120614/11342_1 /TAXON_ID=2856 /ORGANISM="Cylindrotheca closterium" /LENGTH=335 /DNA_ID=CAMNT_0000531957 /DNA_START=199 /DNA_END=1206 /DNA_ORIENTATION=+ /assembly_acc=CAM_ASM_000147